MTKQILNQLWQVGGPGHTGTNDAAAYLVRMGNSAALVDAGCGQHHDRLVDNIAQCLGDMASLDYLLLTHCHYDHSGGAEAVRTSFGCQLVAHTLDADFLEAGDSEVTAASWYGEVMAPLRIDVRLEGAENTIAVGNGTITAIHWPGHSPGSLVFTTQLENRRVLFGQDVHGPIHPSLRSDAHQYQASLKKLLKLDADLLLEGHFGIFTGKEAVAEFIRSFIV